MAPLTTALSAVRFVGQPHAWRRLAGCGESLAEIAATLAAVRFVAAPPRAVVPCAFGGPQVVRAADLDLVTGWRVTAPDLALAHLGPGAALTLELLLGDRPPRADRGLVPLDAASVDRLTDPAPPVVTVTVPPGWRGQRALAEDPRGLDHRGLAYLGLGLPPGGVVAAGLDAQGRPHLLRAPEEGDWQVLSRDETAAGTVFRLVAG